MDKASLIGTILGVVVIVGTVGLVLSHGGNIMMFWSLKGVIMVFGGTISVLFMAMPMDKLKQVPGYIKAFMREPSASNGETVTLMATLSDKARRDGILALESEIEDISDPFLAQGLKMAVDGTDEAIVETTLRLEVMAMQERHKAGKKFFDLIKLYGIRLLIKPQGVGAKFNFQTLILTIGSGLALLHARGRPSPGAAMSWVSRKG